MPDYMLHVRKERVADISQPTAKAQDYANSLKIELNKKGLKSSRRAEIEEDLAKIASGHFELINGVTHFYLDEGPAQGEPVVFVHGWDCSSFWWHNVTADLNKLGYRTINYDLRGHGFTDDNPLGDEDYRLERMVEDLEALRIKLNLDKFHLATFSLGSVIATSYAARFPERVASLVCFNFGLFRYNAQIEKVMPRALSTIFSKVLKPVGPKSWRFVYAYVRMTLTKNPVDRRDILYGLLSLKDCSFRASYNSCRSIMSKEVLGPLPEWAASITAPTLLVAGSHDRVIGRRNSDALAKVLPNVTYFVMPKCGHLVLGELPEQVTALMTMHLGRSDLTSELSEE